MQYTKRTKCISAITVLLMIIGMCGIFVTHTEPAYAVREVPRNAMGIPSPLGFYFDGEYYDMWPDESGGIEGTARWTMDHDGYFTITLEKTVKDAPFYFTNSYPGTQARFGGLAVAGGGGGGGGVNGVGGAGGEGGSALLMAWAEPFWNDDTSKEYGMFYNPDHIPSGWKIDDYLYAEDNVITVGKGGSGGASYTYWGTEQGEGTYNGGDGGNGESTVFCGYTVPGGKGGNKRVSSQDIHDVNWAYATSGKVYDGAWNEIGSSHEIIWFGENVYFGKGAGSGGRNSEHYEHPVQHLDWGVIDWGHDFLIYYASGGQTFTGLGNGGGGSGVNSDWTYSKRWSETSASPVVYRTSSGGTPGKPGTVILEGKADLVTVRVYKTVNDWPADRTEPLDTSTLSGFQFLVHNEEGYIEDFILETDQYGKAERGGMPLGHYTVTEITQIEKMKGYLGYMNGSLYEEVFLNSLELF